MAIQANALPPSLVAELNEMKRRLDALERKPKLGSVNERLTYSSWQSPSAEGTQSETMVHGLGTINSTGLNQPVVILQIPFHIPWANGAVLDVSVTLWLQDTVTGAKTKEITLTKADDRVIDGFGGYSRGVTFAWIHPQPIGFADTEIWKGFEVNYRVNKRVSVGGLSLTVGLGDPNMVTGVPLGTFVEESTDGNPRVDGALTPVSG
ncbi:minor tail protein [Streptomyces phage TG1]|uniref:Minor tail protein n=1 Tax=Streptomyces phage TG1 TaxID=2927987 RepID=K4HYI9_9CAUD|nr:minor tail protein [Streptomyces phage TG1]AFU62211.1 minor tail protein [Streptomyces phage TG1]